jgi:hypothetical protein
MVRHIMSLLLLAPGAARRTPERPGGTAPPACDGPIVASPTFALVQHVPISMDVRLQFARSPSSSTPAPRLVLLVFILGLVLVPVLAQDAPETREQAVQWPYCEWPVKALALSHFTTLHRVAHCRLAALRRLAHLSLSGARF